MLGASSQRLWTTPSGKGTLPGLACCPPPCLVQKKLIINSYRGVFCFCFAFFCVFWAPRAVRIALFREFCVDHFYSTIAKFDAADGVTTIAAYFYWRACVCVFFAAAAAAVFRYTWPPRTGVSRFILMWGTCKCFFAWVKCFFAAQPCTIVRKQLLKCKPTLRLSNARGWRQRPITGAFTSGGNPFAERAS